MRNKIVNIIIIVVLVAAIIAVFFIQENRIDAEKSAHQRYCGNQAFSVMMFLSREMRDIVDKYENETLTNEVLNKHYKILDSYVLSVYNQQPASYISTINRFRFIEKHSSQTYDESTYKQYMKIIDLFDATYHEIENKYVGDDQWLGFYNVYSGETFNNQLEMLLTALQAENSGYVS